jgi:hypothetical protein
MLGRTYRSYHVNCSKKGLLPTWFLKIGIVSVFPKYNTTIFYLSHKKSTTKKLHHSLFHYSRSFYRKNKCLGALQRYFIDQNSKNIKYNNWIINWFKSLEMELIKMGLFKKSKNNNDEQQPYDASFLQAVNVAVFIVFLNEFLKMATSIVLIEFSRFLLHFCAWI